MSETQGHAIFHACLGAWLGSQPTVRLGLRPKMAVAAVVLGANDVTMRVMARRGHGEPLAHMDIFQLPFLLAWLVVLGMTRGLERRMRMVRVHEERLASRQEEVAALKEHLSEVEGQKQHLEDERRTFTHAVYSKFVRESVGLQTGSKHHARPGGRGEREPSTPSPLRQ